jgi:hypothetical protein
VLEPVETRQFQNLKTISRGHQDCISALLELLDDWDEEGDMR